MTTYKLIKDDLLGEIVAVQELPVTTFIPFYPANTDYQEYLKWLAEGNTPEAANEV